MSPRAPLGATRRLRLAFLLVACLGLLAAAVAVRSTFPRSEGTVNVPGISAPVRILFDARGVPTIRASSVPDAMFGLGYVHARDRLWQMEFQRRVGAGRLAEILGEKLLPTDRFLRTVGFRRAAESAWQALEPPERQLLEAYARGVDAYRETSGARPIEFRLLRVDPGPWDPVDSLAWAKMMAWDLAGNARDEIRRARFAAVVGRTRADELLPVAASEPTILTDQEWRSASGPVSRAAARPAPVLPRAGPALWARLDRRLGGLDGLGFGGEDLGSNSWVLAGSRTTTGLPILANDPHLGLRAPSVWYVAALEAPGLSVAGATLPGIPGVIIGHNDRIAWGLTSIEPDVQDLFVEEVDPRDPGRYRHRGQWLRFGARQEVIRVRGAADVALTVRSSVHGPIVGDLYAGAENLGPAVALRWTGLDPGDRTAAAFFRIETARDWRGFLEGARLLHGPPQNLLYADVEGHIGYTASGAMPVRPRGDGRWPVSGAGEDDWTGTVPFDALPRVLDPARGYLVTANNRVVSGEYPYSFGSNWAEPFRARRIAEMISARARLSPADALRMQLDHRSLEADELLPLLLDTAPAGAASRDALERLRRWDRVMAPDSIPASLYAAWFVALAKMPEDELGKVPRGSTRFRFVLDALRSNSAWCDDARTPRRESCAEFRSASLREAVGFLARRLGSDPSGWRWERVHRAVFAHAVFDSVPVLRHLFDLESGHGGDPGTVDVGGFAQDGSFRMRDGASYRQVIDLSDLTRSAYVLPGGQSGNVFDRHYRDLLPDWRAGKLFSIRAEPSGAAIVLEPGP
jgi:penicillin amidase